MTQIKISGKVPAAIWPALFVTGVELPLSGPMSVACWLTRELGLDPAYVAEKIGAAFLDGRPVDDFEQTQLRPGATLALGAAVPGLVGISLNRGSPLACFRHDISQSTAAAGAVTGEAAGHVRLKLFNFPARDISGCLAARGIVVTGEQLARWSGENARELGEAGVRFGLGDGAGEMDAAGLARSGLPPEERVLLRA